MRNLRVWDGKHIEVKLKEIIPQLMEENEVKDSAEKVEQCIKLVSDETMLDGQRTIRGVMRVGPSAKGKPQTASFLFCFRLFIPLPSRYSCGWRETSPSCDTMSIASNN